MSVFFFTVGLEIKHELRHGSLASIKAALLPCMAALGGMVTPMAVYAIAQLVMPGGSMGAIAVPMATDIAFALGVLGFFRTKMPAAATAFLLTLATVDDLGAILVLATCFAKNVAMPFLGAAAAITATLTAIGRSGSSDIKPFAVGGVAMWWCSSAPESPPTSPASSPPSASRRMRTPPARPPPARPRPPARPAAHAAARPAARPFPTASSRPHHHALSSSPLHPPSSRRRIVPNTGETRSARMLRVLAPISAFLIMPLFALANTTKDGAAAGAAAGGSAAATGGGDGRRDGGGRRARAAHREAARHRRLLAALAETGPRVPLEGDESRALRIVGLLGGIGFTMCLLLTEVAITGRRRRCRSSPS